MSDWYIIRVSPNTEARSCAWIQSQCGGETYYPVSKHRAPFNHTTHSGEIIERAAIPGYILARFTETPSWTRMRYCECISGLLQRLKTGDDPTNDTLEPMMLRDCEVMRIREREAAGEFNTEEYCRIGAEALIGMQVRIPYGPFVGFSAPIVRVKDNIVLLNLTVLGKTQKVPFEIAKLFPNGLPMDDTPAPLLNAASTSLH